MIFLLFLSSISVLFDYEDEETKTIVSKVFLGSGEVSAIVPKQIVEIQSTIDSSSFGEVSNIIESIEFEIDSKIERIGSYCFTNCVVLKSVDMSRCEKLTILNDYTFNNCKKLTDILFPPNLDRILSYCFCNCFSLEEFQLPNSTSLLSTGSFRSCMGLKYFYVTPNISTIKEDCFYGDSNLAKVEYVGKPIITYWGGYSLGRSIIESFFLPKCVTYVGICLFEDCKMIRKIDIEDGSNFFFENGMLFYNMNKTLHLGLKSISGIVNVSENVEKVSSHIFKFCDNIIEIHFLNANTTFEGVDHFYQCLALKKVTLPQNLKAIPNSMFSVCRSIEEIIIPSSVTNIGSESFSHCTSLKHLHLSANITSFGSGFLNGVPLNIEISSDSGSNYIFEDNHLYGENYSSVVVFLGESGDVTIPSNAITIIGHAYYNKQISSVEFQENSKLKYIQNWAFAGCTKLTSIILPNTVESISISAFQGCSLVEEFYFGLSLKEIQDNAFINFGSVNGVKAAELPSSLQSIGKSAFENSKFIGLNIKSDSNLSTVGQGTFCKMPKIESISFSSSLSSIGKLCFSMSSITKVSFNDGCSLNIIPIESFLNCTSLKDIAISSGVVKIDERAFAGCSSIKSIMLGRSVESISYLAFGDCSSLDSFIIPPLSQLTEIMGQAFFGCSKLKSFTIFGSSEFESRGGALYGKNGKVLFTYLSGSVEKIVEIEDGVEKINKFAFQLASGVEEIRLPSTLREIGFRSFDRCSNLQKILVRSTELYVEVEAFRECIALSRCDCINISAGSDDIKKALIDGGVPETGFNECPSQYFTHARDIHFHAISTLASLASEKAEL